MNAFAARLLLDQPDPPRKVGVGTVFKTDVSLLAVLLIPVVVLGGGFFDHRLFVFALISVGFLGVGLQIAARQNAGARWALQFGIAAAGQITRVEPGFRGSKIVTVHVDGPSGATDADTPGAADPRTA